VYIGLNWIGYRIYDR